MLGGESGVHGLPAPLAPHSMTKLELVTVAWMQVRVFWLTALNHAYHLA